MSFAAPGYLALLLLAPLAGGAYVALGRWRRVAAKRFAPGRPVAEIGGGSSRSRALKSAMVVLAVAVVAVALARPRFGEEHVVVERAGADVVIALDVSRSMLAGDIAPDRQTLALEQTKRLVERLRGHRVSLVIFAGSAVLRSPPTADTEPIRALLESAQADAVLVEPGSDLGAAVRTALRTLQGSDAESRAIILVTDGEDHAGDALAAAQAAAGQDMIVYAAGFGTFAGAAVPGEEPVDDVPPVTRLNEGLLRRMAATSPEGRYVPGERAVDLAADVNALARTTFATERQRVPIERFQWVVLVALSLLVAETLVPERGWRIALPVRLWQASGAAAALALIVVAGGACSSAADDLIADGNAAYGRGDYAEALEAFRRAAVEEPDRPEPHYDAGLSLHRLEQYELAATETVRSLPIGDPVDAAHAYYNLGSHYARSGALDEAFSAFRQALLLDPGDVDAKYNLELVRRLIEQQSGIEAAPRDAHAADDDSAHGAEESGGLGLEGQAEAVRRAIEAAAINAGEELSVAEALEALALAQELNALLPLTGETERPDPSGLPDY